MQIPEYLVFPFEEFAADMQRRMDEGKERLRYADVAVVGLARNCAPQLNANLRRAAGFGAACRSWALHVETNDNTDETVDVLQAFAAEHSQASFTNRTTGRAQRSAEFAGPRTQALAEYRTACQSWVREHRPHSDYVVVVDFDAWGGWTPTGLLAAFGWLVEMQGAFGMAAVSLCQMEIQRERGWLHYDCWALRGVGQPRTYWDDYSKGMGGWKHHFLPAVGTPPVLVGSAFGGLCVYRTEDYLAGTYSGEDCEHVPFHRSIAEATGRHLYLCPAMRTIMHWCPEETADGRRDGND